MSGTQAFYSSTEAKRQSSMSNLDSSYKRGLKELTLLKQDMTDTKGRMVLPMNFVPAPPRPPSSSSQLQYLMNECEDMFHLIRVGRRYIFSASSQIPLSVLRDNEREYEGRLDRLRDYFDGISRGIIR